MALLKNNQAMNLLIFTGMKLVLVLMNVLLEFTEQFEQYDVEVTCYHSAFQM